VGRLRYFLISIKSVFDYDQSLALRHSGDIVVRETLISKSNEPHLPKK